MSIRRTLSIAFLTLTLASTAILTALAFFQARQTLKEAISNSLTEQAVTSMALIDRLMFERLSSIHTWSHLEIMQDIRVRDLDKRLSRFLSDMQAHYGIFERLYATLGDGTIVAATDPTQIGSKQSATTDRLTANLPDGEVFLQSLPCKSPQLCPPLPKSEGNRNQAAALLIRAPIPNAFGTGELGNLYVSYDYQDLQRLLDRLSNDGQRLALLLDDQGQVLVASAKLRELGLPGQRLANQWLSATHPDDSVNDDEDNVLGSGPVLIGQAHSGTQQGSQALGWSLLLAKPLSSAFQPIERMKLMFFLLLGITGTVAVVLAHLVAGRIARPIVQLTRFTRRFMRFQHTTDIPTARHGEVGELTSAFVQMIEALEQSRQNLVRTAKLATVGELAAIMAHEVRTPLGILRSSAQMLKREPTLSADGRELLDFIVSESDRLNKLVSTLLEAARPRPTQFHQHDLHRIIQRSVDLLGHQAQKKNIRLETRLHATDPLLACDEEQLVQVLLNLILNAIQHTPTDGTVQVSCREENVGLTLEVDDSGSGISEENRALVFDPFFTRREGGIGLGLAVVQQIVTAHGGKIRVDSAPLGGARFHIFLPRHLDPTH